jgi:hypothetical protein
MCERVEIHRREGAWNDARSDLSTPVEKRVERGELPAKSGFLPSAISPGAGIEAGLGTLL